jgi:hypothetical protein
LATNADNSGQVLTPKQEAIELFEKLHKQKNPSVADMVRLQKLIVSTPDVWWLASLAMPPGWSSLIEKTSSGVINALMRADMDILKKQMDYDSSSALEQMHIDHLLTAQLHLRRAEQNYNSQVLSGESFGLEVGRFWQDFLESAQLRFQRASESLAKIRRLARITPALQINIAQAGSKQVNVQGDGNPTAKQTTTGDSPNETVLSGRVSG